VQKLGKHQKLLGQASLASANAGHCTLPYYNVCAGSTGEKAKVKGYAESHVVASVVKAHPQVLRPHLALLAVAKAVQ
jgi:hypothetical protein